MCEEHKSLTKCLIYRQTLYANCVQSYTGNENVKILMFSNLICHKSTFNKTSHTGVQCSVFKFIIN